MPAKKVTPALPDLYCIDASIYIFRAYFSMPESIRDAKGRPVNAVYGFTDFLIKLIQETRPTHIAAFFDESLTTSFRNQLYAPYKANRELPPEDLERQLTLCREISRLLGAGDWAHAIYEADDLIGACMRRHRAKIKRAIIVSSDKDLAQLLLPDDVLWDYARERRFDPAAVEAHFGVPPQYIADYLALSGDAVDNIPGLPGIGQKTAAALIQQYGGLDQILKQTARIAESVTLRGARKIAETLRTNADQARLFLSITRIATGKEVGGPGLRELKYRAPDVAGLTALFEREGFGDRLKNRVEKFAAALLK